MLIPIFFSCDINVVCQINSGITISTEEQTVLEFFSQEDNLPLALSVAELVDKYPLDALSG